MLPTHGTAQGGSRWVLAISKPIFVKHASSLAKPASVLELAALAT